MSFDLPLIADPRICKPAPRQLKAVFEFLVPACRPGPHREHVLRRTGEEAQRTIDGIQTWINHVPVYHPLRRSALYLLRTLSQSTGKLPNQNVIEEDLGYDKKPPVATKNAYVYKGWYINEAVAVKKLPDLGDMKLRKDFYRECITWAQLKHEHILPLRGVQIEKNELLLVSPWAQYGDLQVYMKNRDLYDPKNHHLDFANQIAQGMAYLHMQKVVHGDIKANNVMVDKAQKVQIADFGLALVGDITHGRYTQTTARGTDGWLAPERYNSGPDTARTPAMDVWAFGLLCFVLAEGSYPWHDLDTGAIMAKVLNGELPPRPRTMDISLAEVAERCMKKKPEDRLTMANVIAYFKQDLQTYIPDSPCFYLKAKKPFNAQGRGATWMSFEKGTDMEIIECFSGYWVARIAATGAVGYVPPEFEYYEDAKLIRAIARIDFPDPKFKGYLSLFKGEEFDVMSINASVWLVRDSAGIVGVIPSSMLQAQWPDFNKRASTSGTFASLTTVASYEPPHGVVYGLKLKAHETLEVFFGNKNSQWYFGRQRSKGHIGIVPAHYLREVPS